MRIRRLQSKDRTGLQKMLMGIPAFDQEDQAIAMELIDMALTDPQQQEYLFFVAVDEGDCPIGYACYGQTPLTEGTYDLYWIAVDHKMSGGGIGTLLLKSVEDDIRERKGRLLIIETSSSDAYEKTRQFYLKNDCPLVETIKDFYRPGEDRVTFIKKMN